MYPAPIDHRDIAAWSDRVRDELGAGALGELIDLLTHGDHEQQYQAMAASRALGAEVWAEGREPNMVWLVTLPGESRQRKIRPEHQLIG